MMTPYYKIIVSNIAPGSEDIVSEWFEGDESLGVTASAFGVTSPAHPALEVELYCVGGCDEDAVARRIDDLRTAASLPDIGWHIEKLEDRDWVAESQAGLPPITAGRFFVHGAHDRAQRPAGAVCIEIEAGQAFGSGHHGTTTGCLMAFDRLLAGRTFTNVLDVGCGSAVLAIAAALAAPARVIASDIDPVAVTVARENTEKNGAAASVTCCLAEGTDHAAIRQTGTFDLVFANILAQPLISLAPELTEVLCEGGCAILSGLTLDQEAGVLSAYRQGGLALLERSSLEGWSTLVLCK